MPIFFRMHRWQHVIYVRFGAAYCNYWRPVAGSELPGVITLEQHAVVRPLVLSRLALNLQPAAHQCRVRQPPRVAVAGIAHTHAE